MPKIRHICRDFGHSAYKAKNSGYYRNPLLIIYSYFNKNFDLDKLMEKGKEMLSAIVDNSECYILRVKEPKEYVKLLREIKRIRSAASNIESCKKDSRGYSNG